MSKTIVIHDDHIDILKDGYNIIEQTIQTGDVSFLDILNDICMSSDETEDSQHKAVINELLEALDY